MKASEIRKEARTSLAGKWGKAASITLAFMALAFAVGFVQSYVGEENPLYSIIDLAFSIINIPLSFGLLISFIKLKRGEDVKAFDYFKEGFSRFKKAWGIYLQTLLKLLVPVIILIILFITIIPLITATVILGETVGFGLVLAFVLLIATSIFVGIKALFYVLAYYISYDNPELSSKECVLRSATLMKGNRGKYFLLELSFIGWAILAAFTFGIGMLWLMPYMQVAIICFYEKLLNPEVKNDEEVINTKE